MMGNFWWKQLRLCASKYREGIRTRRRDEKEMEKYAVENTDDTGDNFMVLRALIEP